MKKEALYLLCILYTLFHGSADFFTFQQIPGKKKKKTLQARPVVQLLGLGDVFNHIKQTEHSLVLERLENFYVCFIHGAWGRRLKEKL